VARLTGEQPAARHVGRSRVTPTQCVVIAMIVGVGLGWAFPDGPNAHGLRTSDLQVASTMFLRLIKVITVTLLLTSKGKESPSSWAWTRGWT